MAKLTIATGVLLALLGVVFFVATGSAHKTALIPLWFSLVLAVCGAVANTEDLKRRALWMHIAVTAGLIGFVFPGFRALRSSLHASTLIGPGRIAMEESWAMAAICFVFTLLCVRNFVANRRARLA